MGKFNVLRVCVVTRVCRSPVVNRDKRVTAERIKYMHENGLEFLADRYVAG